MYKLKLKSHTFICWGSAHQMTSKFYILRKELRTYMIWLKKLFHLVVFPLQDVMHLFKGDYSVRQFEAGQQKGRNYVCTTSSVHSDLISSL